MGESHRLNLVAKIAEVVGMDDVDDMPEVLKRAEEAREKAGRSFKEGLDIYFQIKQKKSQENPDSFFNISLTPPHF